MFEPVSNKPDFCAVELEALAYWEREKVFERTLQQRAGAPEFVFYDGPPFATGLPHYGHLLAGTIKDIVPRYQTMRGKRVERRFGWDCHGLPVECEVEQDLGIGGKSQIEQMGVDVFNEKCRSIVLRYTREWRSTVTRMGRWVDFDNEYRTMDLPYMESIWWVFKTLWDKGLIYQGDKILPYCPRCATPLSNFETNQGYVEVSDPAITVRFALRDEPNAYILAWTTTPWTLPSNLALAVGAAVTYAKVYEKEAVYYLARDQVATYYPDASQYERIEEVSGRDLAGREYEPLFPYFAEQREQGAFRVVTADFVATDAGTGVVHIAPGFGEDDSALAKEKKLPVVCPVDAECRFTDAVPDYAGRSVKETDKEIVQRLKREGRLVHRTTLTHPYPHCWRCEAALIYRSVDTWFVHVEAIKPRLIELNREVNWVPAHLRDGRFGKWLEGARDWAISRNRFWGTPLPVWRSADGEETVCLGSVRELEERTGQKADDLHKHFMDKLEIPSREGRGPLRRVPEVLDCWFESGAMPYAQAHYPFENREWFEQNFPPDFIAEGLDQTRGWFYTLMVLSTALFDRPAFRNVVVNGLILAEDGKKMSKRLKNYPDQGYMIRAYGADALRLYMIYSPVVRAESLRFSEKGVQHLLRHIFLPLWNAYSFLVTYARIDGWFPDGTQAEPGASANVLDRWILSSLETLVQDVTEAMDRYDLQRAVRPFIRFIEDLTNWYIRRSRRRFWKSQDDDDKRHAYGTLHHVLLHTAQVAAPFIPMISESIYRNLRTAALPDSVHLCDFPNPRAALRDPDLERDMAAVMSLVRMGRQLRADHNLKVRQPLACLRVVNRDVEARAGVAALQELLMDELNVKRISFESDERLLAHLQAKADFRRLGPRFGPRTAQVAARIAALSSAEVGRWLHEGVMELEQDAGEPVRLTLEDAIVERRPIEGLVVASDGEWVVALETELSSELRTEGLARELVNKVQTMRKNAGLDVTQRIRLWYAGPDPVRHAMETHGEYIGAETLCIECVGCESLDPEAATDWDVNGHPCRLRLEPVAAEADEPGGKDLNIQ